MDEDQRSAPEFWEEFYAEGRSPWSGRPNASLVEETEDLPRGTALELGCGQGADAIWLAQQGWTVTAVDISANALATAERHAAAAGIGGTIRWERHDLAASMPAGTFDLVSASFLHSPVPLPREAVLRAAAAAVAPGGTLLVIGHAPSAGHTHVDLPTLEDVVADLALPDAEWTIHTQALRARAHAFADEEPIERVDTVLRVQRR